jgi:hypothetical protein
VRASVNGMGGNRISEMIMGTVESVSNVKRLDLRHNRLQHLDSDVLNWAFKF